ncbi:MFS transporter [Piscinibacter sp. XHJ-5]|uniref:MFS transporter n=1 Tax=Piscinibacter sp. XHJ-5 TaxID=3037797 RepID=UPI002453717E|nr:MFS transporter [Piscinibacter sp. XHJ-5]
MLQRVVDEAAIAGRMDRLPLTAMHVWALGLCALGFAFDLLEIGLGSALAPVFSTPPHSARTDQLSLLLAAVYLGAVVGAPLLGWVADRYGRRSTMIGLLLWLAVTSFGAAGAPDVTQLTLLRGLSGLALGAYPPLMIAYLTDLMPPRRRGTLIFVVVAVASLGAPAGILLLRWLTPLQPLDIEAWRWAFVAGGTGAAIAGLLFLTLPESARWLEAEGREGAALKACRRFERSRVLLRLPQPDPVPEERPAEALEAARPGRLVRRWSLVGGLFLLSPWATVAFPLLSGAVLTQKGFKLSDTLLYVALSMCGPFIGTLLVAGMIDSIERRKALTVSAVAMVASGACFAVSDSPAWLIVSSIVFGVFTSLYVSTLNVYGAELFPTRSRASSIAGAWALNRVGAVLAPLLLLPLLTMHGPLSMFAVIAATLVASAVLLLVAPPGQQRKAVA